MFLFIYIVEFFSTNVPSYLLLYNSALQSFILIYTGEFCFTNVLIYLHFTMLPHKCFFLFTLYNFNTQTSSWFTLLSFLHKFFSLFTLKNFALQIVLPIYIVEYCSTNVPPYLLYIVQLLYKCPLYLHCTILFYKCSSIVTLYNLLYSYSSLFSLYNFALQMFLLIYMAQFPTQYILWHADIPIPYYVYSICNVLSIGGQGQIILWRTPF